MLANSFVDLHTCTSHVCQDAMQAPHAVGVVQKNAPELELAKRLVLLMGLALFFTKCSWQLHLLRMCSAKQIVK